MKSSLTKEYFLQVVGDEIDPAENRSAEIDDLLKRSENMILGYTSPAGDPASGIWVDAICSSVQMDMVLRVWYNRRGLASEAMGPENQSFVAPGGLMILPAEREQLDRLKTGASLSNGLGTLRTYRRDFSSDFIEYF